jgi:Tfp pilus assembly protein PilF
LRNDPYYINNLVNAAGVEMELGMLATARQRLEKTLAINDELHLAWYALGLIHQRQGRVEAAREAFQACVDIADFDLAQAQLRALPPTR